MAAQPGELTLELKRVFPADRPGVFQVFTSEEQLPKWWGPKGFTIARLEFRPRVGDGYRIEMQPPEGDAFFSPGSSARSNRPLVWSTRSRMRIPIPTTSRTLST